MVDSRISMAWANQHIVLGDIRCQFEVAVSYLAHGVRKGHHLQLDVA
jgi:hypothetical protein